MTDTVDGYTILITLDDDTVGPLHLDGLPLVFPSGDDAMSFLEEVKRIGYKHGVINAKLEPIYCTREEAS